MEFHEISTQSGVRKVESRTSHRLMPFTEMAKWILGVEIHGTSTTNCSAAVRRLDKASRPSEAAKIPSELTSAHIRLIRAEEERGMPSAMSNAASGRKSTAVRRFIEQDLRKGPWRGSEAPSRIAPMWRSCGYCRIAAL